MSLNTQGRGTAWAIWDGGVALSLYLDCLLKTPPLWLQNSLAETQQFIIVELGSGTGLAGLATAAAFHEKVVGNLKVVLTDVAEALPALDCNVAANPLLENVITTTECDWFNPDVDNLRKLISIDGNYADQKQGINLILAADCVWLEDLVPPFVTTLEKLIKNAGSTDTRVLLAYQSRSSRVDDLLFGLLKTSFSIEEAELLVGEQYSRGKIEISWLRPLPSMF